MKKLLILILSATFMISCGGKDEKKEEKQEIKLKDHSQNKATTPDDGVAADLNNLGIGPIKSVDISQPVNQEMANLGEQVFNAKCTACHKVDTKLLGPPMKGVLEKRNPVWVMNMMLNPTEMIQKDPTAKALLAQYNNLPMTPMGLTEEDARNVLEYMRTL